MSSLRRWLLVALLGALLLAGLVASVGTYVSARSEVDSQLDEELRQVALSLRDHARLDLMRLDRAGSDPGQRVLVQIWDPAFERPYSSQIAAPMPRQSVEGYTTLDHEGRQWRVFTTFAMKQTVQVAQPTSLRRELAARTAARLLIPVLIVLPLLGLVGWWIVGRGLAPLRTTAAALAARPLNSLEPVPARDLPIELQPLVDALNGLLTKLGEALTLQRRFAADAAHELRTPLTALTLQVQLAQRATEPAARDRALERLAEGVKRASRLVQQLLTMARLEPEAADAKFATFDLGALVDSVAEDFQPLAAQRSIALRTDCRSALIAGQADALRILVNNLIDNAIRYTPMGGSVTASTRAAGGPSDEVILEVADSGPGVAADQRERVFERFYRGTVAAGDGSGLGLAIARRIVEMHGGQIELGENPGGGLLVRVRFPQASADGV